MSNHYVEYVIRGGNDSVTCTNKDDAYRIYSLWLYNADSEEDVILVQVDTHEEVLESNV
jgi:hypothetical protein